MLKIIQYLLYNQYIININKYMNINHIKYNNNYY